MAQPYLYGGGGADLIVGSNRFGPADRIDGQGGNDIMVGGEGDDSFYGGAGDDTFVNDDGVAETVHCGDGIDDPEPTANDSYFDGEDI